MCVENDDSVIEMHATWIAVNSIIGCTNGCKYCFLQSTKDNLNRPKYRVSYTEAIEQLINSKYYLKTIPVCLLQNTDAFLNKENIDYLIGLLNEIKLRRLKNPIIIITKCLIPTGVIKLLKEYQENGIKLVIYLSFSGLPKELEPNVNHEDIKTNFIKLNEKGIKVIHYFRPIMPINSTEKCVEKVMNFVSKYSKISVIGGLKIKGSYFDLMDFWPEIKNKKKQCLRADSIWPRKTINKFNSLIKKYDHNVFRINFCALMGLLGRSSAVYYNTNECKNYRLCSEEQRKKCREQIKNKKVEKDSVKFYLRKLGYFIDERKIRIRRNKIILKKVGLNIGDIAYLTYALNSKVISEEIKNGEYWNSPLIGSKPIII